MKAFNNTENLKKDILIPANEEREDSKLLAQFKVHFAFITQRKFAKEILKMAKIPKIFMDPCSNFEHDLGQMLAKCSAVSKHLGSGFVVRFTICRLKLKNN